MSSFKDNAIKTTLAPTVSIVPTPPPPEPTATLGQKSAKDKVDLKYEPMKYYIKSSFMITYILLLTTATITFIEAIRTSIPEIRHILNLETAVSLIAGYFYSVFLTQLDNDKTKAFEWKDVTKTRYVDWSITTPIMLLVLCIFLGKESGREIGLREISVIWLLDYLMLGFGYLGEANVFNPMLMFFLSFGAFFAMFYYIFIKYVNVKFLYGKNCLFLVYLVLWGIYGIAFLFEESYKNIAYNILDCVSKCFVGLGLWLYYTKLIKIKY
jgi:bacteriorhodopsin